MKGTPTPEGRGGGNPDEGKNDGVAVHRAGVTPVAVKPEETKKDEGGTAVEENAHGTTGHEVE